MAHPGTQVVYQQAPDSSTSINFDLYPSVRRTDSDPDSGTATPRSEKPRRINPFATPYGSSNVTRAPSPTFQHQVHSTPYFHSRRVQKGEVEKPWTKKKDPHEKWVSIIALLGIVAGLGIAAVLVWDGLRGVVHQKYCVVLDDDFASGFNTDVWTKEAEVGGFGNGQFEETTTTDENVFVRGGVLTIRPTLQDNKLITEDNVIDLRKDGICSSDIWSNCLASTNTTNGTIIPPVRSGRIDTNKGARIRYGRVEVTAKIPEGDWLWPAIWMLPSQSVYGPWPQSGEIDIMESRGNNHTYAQGGNNIISSALHWGPNSANDAWWRTNVKRNALHTTFAAKYHTFGIEWSEKYIFTYIDTRLLQVLYTNFDTPLWERGAFPLSDQNGTRLIDPWSQTGRPSTPFDQDFYLIINVAVGGTNGWFQDGESDKPWVDGSDTAKKDFWDARGQWLPTWRGDGKGEMHVTNVRMWQQEGYNGCENGKSLE
jgi:Glycosyl hydrolases family 16